MNEFWDVRTQGLATDSPTTGGEKAVIAVGASLWLLGVLWFVLVALLVVFAGGPSD